MYILILFKLEYFHFQRPDSIRRDEAYTVFLPWGASQTNKDEKIGKDHVEQSFYGDDISLIKAKAKKEDNEQAGGWWCCRSSVAPEPVRYEQKTIYLNLNRINF